MSTYLAGKLLVAMPQMKDPRFHNSVIYICGHDEKGAMGLIINKNLESLSFSELLDQLKIENIKHEADAKLHYGGPVELGRGFILHTEDYLHESSIRVAKNIILTSNLEVLRLIAKGMGPERFLLTLGYTGWSSGQLEKEIKENGWIQVDADLDIIYSDRVDRKWLQALAKIGVDPDMLSSESGQA